MKTQEISISLADMLVNTKPDSSQTLHIPRDKAKTPATMLAGLGFTYLETVQGRFMPLHIYQDTSGKHWKVGGDSSQYPATLNGKLTEQVPVRLLPYK